MNTATPRQSSVQWLAFHVDGVEYGIDLLQVQEIQSYQAPARIANAAAYCNGVLDLRGEVVPVIDLRLRLGLQARPYDACTVTIVLRLPQGVVGMVVESVTDVVTLEPGHLRAVPAMRGCIAGDCLLAMAVLDKRSLLLVDACRLMDMSAAGLAAAVPAVHHSFPAFPNA
ncbi:Chemotaxis protein CheW [Delftia tsuruhatensis]|uniref:chemotaxis protein CheW n=1 Tax=Delftia tsuruhatensis TaxID=180282 RepID=UPI001E7B7DF4|nr:chemotaxis protein CheW [Delftia tsuruhatensis]CAB5694929.1 Chemotaxis protein CheW [Delftia tsuruhatensis]CAC9687054.1 Chemotaxis protein CheW [Delftia tsuruhatensis]